jgi:hypothetical protein
MVLPPRLRLPTLFRPLSLSRWRARPEAAPGAIHPWPPRAARRLSISATVTTHEHNCAIVQTPPTTPVVAHVRSFLHFMHECMKRSAGGRASRHSQPRFHGPEACEGLRRREASPRRDRSRWRLHPNPIDPDTSCRELVMMQVGVTCTAGMLRREHPVTRSPTSPACAGPAHRVASRVLPRRRPRSAAPEVPSTHGPPREGLVSFPQTVPSLWIGDRAPFRSRTIAARDGDAKREDSGSLEQPAREPA